MASAASVSAALSVTGIAAINSGTLTKSITFGGDSDVFTGTQTVGTSSEIVSIPAEIAAGDAEYICIKNLDAVNFVSIGFNNPVVAGSETLKLLAGYVALLPFPSAALYAIADTASCTIQVWAVEST